MGTEEPNARRKGGLELPPVGWAEALDTDMNSGVDKSAQSALAPVPSVVASTVEQS